MLRVLLEFLTQSALIHDGARSLVYRGLDDGVPVVVKLIREAYPSRRRLASARREFRILERLDTPFVPEAIRLHEDGNRLAVVMRDPGNRATDLTSLHDLTTPLPLARFFPLAIDLADALRAVHAEGVVHKDIKPANILVEPDSWRAQLIDFDVSSELAEEQRLALPPDRIEGTLAYISPEQTGRMNRPLDLRSDFYSLGVTFFQLLAGRLPFEAEDALALVHAHIALAPPRLDSLRPELPPKLVELVHILLAKQSEERYQSAWGLAADLRRLQAAWADGADCGALRTDDVPETFRLSRRLYGREDSVADLLAAFDRTSVGRAELVLVAGVSGVGKSSLIHEVHRALAGKRGLFVEGKFDQLRRGVPYESLADALRDLVRQLMTESEERLSEWRDELRAALGKSGQVVVDIIPELERLIGPQPPAPDLAPAEALNRLGLLFQRLFAVFARPEHPLVLFLDDLQWADNASLRLLELLLADPTRRGLLVVGAYRDNEVGPTHPLVPSLAQMESSGTTLCRLTLAPLDSGAVQELLADSFGTRGEEAVRLADLLIAKTGGNPFFLVRFLHALHDEGLLARDVDGGRWTWDVDAIGERSITDNVVELVSGRLRGLPEDTQRVLPLGASLGARFSLADLAAVAELPATVAARALWPAVEAGLVLPQEQEHRLIPTWTDESEPPPLSFRFLHDRVQQASWLLLPEERHGPTHLAVGRRLAGDTPPEELGARLFDAVGHFNAASTLVQAPAELRRVAELGLAAGHKARRSGAYGVAAELLDHALAFTRWLDEEPALSPLLHALNLHRGASLSQLGRAEEAAACFEEALRHAPDLHARVAVHIDWCLGLLYGGDHAGVMQRGLQALAELDVHMPPTHEARMGEGLALMGKTAGAATPDDIAALADLPRMTDARGILIAQILACISPSAYITNADEQWFLWVSFFGLELVMEHGNAPGSCHGYSLVGMTLCAMGDIERGIAFHRTAVALADRMDDLVQRLRTWTCFGFHQPWRDPPAECVRVGRRAFRFALDGGDWFHASYAATNVLHSGLYGGMALEELAEDASAYLDFMLPHGLELGPFVQAVDTLQRRLRAGVFASGEFTPEWQAEIEGIYSEAARVWPLVVACFAATLDGDSQRALDLARRAWVGYVDCRNFGDGGELPFLHGLAAARLATGVHAPDLAAEARTQQEDLARWAAESPSHYGAKAKLLAGAIHTMDGAISEAVQSYFDALDGARTSGLPVIEALASEALAELQVERGFAPYAHLHALDAAHAWQRWGAEGLGGRVQQRWPEATRFLGSTSLFGAPGPAGRTGTVTEDEAMDLETAMNAAEVLAGEVDLSPLMRSLLQLAASNAGADTSTLVLAEDGRIVVRARWRSDPEQFELLEVPVERAEGLPRSALRSAVRLGEALVVDDARADSRFAGDPHIVEQGTRSLLVLPLLRRGEPVAAVVLENRLVGGAFTPERVRVLTLLSSQMAIALENARLIGEIRASLDAVSALSVAYRRFVPHQVVDLLGKESILDVRVGDRVEQSVAVLFSDIRSFTSLSEELGGVATFDFLNGYLGRVAPVVRACSGFIDKYVGDAVMALFPGGAADAYEAALGIQRELDAMNEARRSRGQREVAAGIGLHLGDAVLGTVGEPERMEGTVISDAVNIGSRLEGLCKSYDARIIASRDFVAAVGRALPGEDLGVVELKGRREPIAVVRLDVPPKA